MTASDDRVDVPAAQGGSLGGLLTHEDWWAVWIAGLILAVAFLLVWKAQPLDWQDQLAAIQQRENVIDGLLASSPNDSPELSAAQDELAKLKAAVAPNPAKGWVTKLQTWRSSPAEAFRKTTSQPPFDLVGQVIIVGAISALLYALAVWVMGASPLRFIVSFAVVYFLTIIAFVMSSQETIKNLNLEYPLWALLVGLVIANTLGTPRWLTPAIKTELYIKTGLVLLGAKILLGRLLALGLPGIGVSWVVTPIVLITTYWFGQRFLRIGSKSLNMTISADMSVCGVSAAIATAAACRAKKEELTVAIGLSLSFTVVMMFAMPAFIKAVGMSEVLGGAWLGGTVDATGAVAAAGLFLGPTAGSVAITVKMIQNILIGVIAFFVALYWVTYVEPTDGRRPDAWEIWRRFPKFVLGFVLASIVFTVLATRLPCGSYQVDSMITGTTDVFRGWFFCLAFVCIGLETNFRTLATHLKGGKPLLLYVVGQSLNLILTLAMAWLMFEVIFPDAARNL